VIDQTARLYARGLLVGVEQSQGVLGFVEEVNQHSDRLGERTHERESSVRVLSSYLAGDAVVKSLKTGKKGEPGHAHRRKGERLEFPEDDGSDGVVVLAESVYSDESFIDRAESIEVELFHSATDGINGHTRDVIGGVSGLASGGDPGPPRPALNRECGRRPVSCATQE